MDNHESYVSLETAQLLKRAGFDWEVYRYYLHTVFKDINFDVTSELLWGGWDNYNKKDDYSAPTLSIAQKWLREVKKCFVVVEFHENDYDYMWCYSIYHGADWVEDNWLDVQKACRLFSYEEILELGINKCLTLLLKEE